MLSLKSDTRRLIVEYWSGAKESFIRHEVEGKESPGMNTVLNVLENIIIEAECKADIFGGVRNGEDPI